MENCRTRLCKGCFAQLCVNNLRCILFQMTKYYVCKCFFDSTLLSSEIKYPPTKFSKKCFKIAENRALLYRTVLLTYITSVCYKCAFHILKVRFYRRWETMDHILKNCNRLFEDTRMNWLKFFGCIKTMFYCRICVLIIG